MSPQPSTDRIFTTFTRSQTQSVWPYRLEAWKSGQFQQMGQDCSGQIIFNTSHMSLHSRAYPSGASRCHSLLVFFLLLVDLWFFDAVVCKSGAYTKFYPPQRSRPQNSHQISLHTSKYFLSAVNSRWWSTTTSGLPKLPLTLSSLAKSLSSMQCQNVSRPLTEIICHFLTPQRFSGVILWQNLKKLCDRDVSCWHQNIYFLSSLPHINSSSGFLPVLCCININYFMCLCCLSHD